MSEDHADHRFEPVEEGKTPPPSSPDMPEKQSAVPASDKTPSALRQRQQVYGHIFQTIMGKDRERKYRNLEVVTAAELHPLRLEDLDRGVRDTYGQVHLSDDAIRGVLHGDDTQLHEELARGLMVNGYDEALRDAAGKVTPSVHQQMYHDLERTQSGDERLGRYEGMCLKKPDGEMLAWATWLKPPSEGITPEYSAALHQVLEHGVTGGGLNYTRERRMERFLRFLPQIVLFDTVVSRHPFAAHRLFAEITQRMDADNIPSDQRPAVFLLYRLHDLEIEQKAPVQVSFDDLFPREGPLVPMENTSSDRFFNDRGCVPFATEENPQGPVSHRTVDESEVIVIPTWLWMVGHFNKVRMQSEAIWQKIRQDYGGAE